MSIQTDTHEATIDHPHALTVQECLDALQSQAAGLEPDDAQMRLERFGPNKLPEPEPDGLLKRFFKHFHDILIYILLAAAGITALLGHWIDTFVILGVVVINALIGFFQEGKAEEALAGIRKMLSLHAQVRRGGDFHDIEAELLVPGDIVRLRSGDKVPADIRLLDATNLRIEESALTGESVAATKQAEPVPKDASLGDRKSMAYSGCLVAAGRGVGVVVHTGGQTQLGRINRMIQEVEKLATPLTRQMAYFGKVLSVVILFLAGLMFAVGWLLHDMPMEDLFFAAIGFAVAAIPEGLPAILSITLALGVQRMALRKAIIRRLPAVETLGSVTVICSDKTGTLTRNEMTARAVVTATQTYHVSGTGYVPEGHIRGADEQRAELGNNSDLFQIIEIMAVCNDAMILEEDGRWILNGEPTEGALRALGRKAEFDAKPYTRLAELPFESETKFMATLNKSPEGKILLLLKGAPDRLLDRCTLQLAANGGTEPLDRPMWEARLEELAAQGQRILAAAWRELPHEDPDALRLTKSQTLSLEDVDQEMIFSGLVGIVDPPRPEAIAAIKICREAGIRVKMITGDHAATAMAIGREMGIGNGTAAITGPELEAASDTEMRRLAVQHDIFARTSPEHKLRLVTALQAEKEVVAMTGDGVNDAPALKRADVGIAMGIKGTEATKEAAEIVLMDDNFATIEHAVEEGRTIYDNLRKAILFLLPTNGAEGLVVLTAIVAGFAVLPLTPVQILWVNMVTAITLAMALAFEPPEPDLMSRPPRRPGTAILGGYFIWRIGFVSVLIGGATLAVFQVEMSLDMDVQIVRTVCVNTLVAGQLFYLFNSRFLREAAWLPSRLVSNKVALIASGVLILLQLIFVYAPFMNLWFGSAPLELRHWLVPLGIGLMVFTLSELEKVVSRKFQRVK
ncbi:cation-transporting P-type ATPase [Desulfonatronum thiodismutans]|uniref:cation-transporting P-type ATPase n=1 Tax=Desulfonatronum thiodismutans TaxID=159290 RepID=UPI0004ABE6C6|nr:cation-transporting P-type ATPase [Desulfonatronum thiodismutans]